MKFKQFLNEDVIDGLKLGKADMAYIKSIDPEDLGGFGWAKRKDYKYEVYTVLDSNDTKIGAIGITIIGNFPFLQIVVDPKFRNQNMFLRFVNLMMKDLSIKTLFSKVFKVNVPSVKAHMKSGFKEVYNDPQKDFIYYSFERS
jgi:RimJ/RimL family protein N-acetyltransferase